MRKIILKGRRRSFAFWENIILIEFNRNDTYEADIKGKEIYLIVIFVFILCYNAIKKRSQYSLQESQDKSAHGWDEKLINEKIQKEIKPLESVAKITEIICSRSRLFHLNDTRN